MTKHKIKSLYDFARRKSPFDFLSLSIPRNTGIAGTCMSQASRPPPPALSLRFQVQFHTITVTLPTHPPLRPPPQNSHFLSDPVPALQYPLLSPQQLTLPEPPPGFLCDLILLFYSSSPICCLGSMAFWVHILTIWRLLLSTHQVSKG